MSEFKITGPGFYRMRDGRKVEIAGAVSAHTEPRYPWLGILPCGDTGCWAADGRWTFQRESDRDIIAPWTEPKTGTVWVTVYEKPCGEILTAASPLGPWRTGGGGIKMLACFSRNWAEGEGL